MNKVCHISHMSTHGAAQKMSSLPENQTLETDDAEFASSRLACCSLARFTSPAVVIPALAVITIVAICAAAYFAGRSSAVASSDAVSAVGQQAWLDNLPLINAATAASSEKFSIATGPVSQEAEGLFVLDNNSGLLQCRVIYPRVGAFRAQFTANVAEALGAGGKGGSYIMVTGRVDFPRASNRPAAIGVVYVMDTASGNYACYGIPFDQTAVPNNRPQQGALIVIGQGSANPVIDRDNLR
jgi:hypothetical protein